MKNLIALSVIFVLLLTGCDQKPTKVEVSDSWKNTICPVMDKEIAQDKLQTVVYEGKTVNLCCKKCVEKFNSDPDKFIEKLAKGSTEKTEETKKTE